ncbi:hypothetical protein A4_511 [Escherichia phage A4]|nr:hypothetical protein A4_511 [Escherichia phage A4]
MENESGLLCFSLSQSYATVAGIFIPCTKVLELFDQFSTRFTQILGATFP